MLYREVGDFKTSYRTDGQTFPIAFDRWRYYVVLAIAICVIPFIINDYWVERGLAAVPDLRHRGHRAEHPDGLLRAGLASALAGSWRWAPMPATNS